jgi:hypothetical protein
LRLERTDLALLARTLRELQVPIQSEVAAARDAWPALVRGLPRDSTPALRRALATADTRAAALAPPPFVTVEGGLTGPAAGIGGLVKSYTILTQRGWRFLTTAAGAPTSAGGGGASGGGTGSAIPSARGADRASFLLTNSGLYVYCVYDAHFELSVIGKKLDDAYRKLGGSAAFGAALTPVQVAALAGAYSPSAARLAPHPAASVQV